MFAMGEVDLVFGDKNLTVTYPNRTQDIYDVATTGGNALILKKNNETINVVSDTLAYLKHTIGMGLSTFGPGKEAPDSFRQAIVSDHAHSSVFWKCKDWNANTTCDFKQTPSEVKETKALAPFDQDACNKYENCHDCISAQEAGDLNCGWCLGGTLNYEKIGNTTFKCGGYKKG